MILLTASLLSFFTMQPATADSEAYQLNRQGRVLLEQHRYGSAVRAFRRAVERAESEIGPQDPVTAMMRRNLALAYVHTGNSAAAEQFAKLALSIVESRFG